MSSEVKGGAMIYVCLYRVISDIPNNIRTKIVIAGGYLEKNV